ncbi:MAG: ABC transporter ATP-binding protein [Chloroflexaceae bacterium]|nr:ABC transporter ATP-binding protein [Chloroflexaceae bacterium]
MNTNLPGAGAALRISGLSFSYPARRGVLHDVGLVVRLGERVGVIGLNGSGKTTLFFLICGILKRETGEVLVFDRPVVPGRFRPDLGLVFQNPDDQLFSPTVGDDVAFGPLNMGLPPDEVTARVHEALKTTGCLALRERAPHHLSGGEKRMAAIACVLAMRPRLLLYDEPDANLDLRARRRLIQLLQASGETMLLASHDLDLVLEVCTRVLILDAGRVVADGLPHEVMDDAALMEAHGLEPPWSLRASITKPHPPKG